MDKISMVFLPYIKNILVFYYLQAPTGAVITQRTDRYIDS